MKFYPIVLSQRILSKCVYFYFLLLISFSSCISNIEENDNILDKNIATIKGQILNSETNEIKIWRGEPMKVHYIDTVLLDSLGYFEYKINGIKAQQLVTIEVEDATVKSRRIVVAPNYEITIFGDRSSKLPFYKTVQFSGLGAIPNQYFNDSTINTPLKRFSFKKYWKKSEQEFYDFITEYYQCKDSILKVVLLKDYGDETTNKINSDFYELQLLSHQFNKASRLLNYADLNSFVGGKAKKYLEKYIDPSVFNFSKYEKLSYLHGIAAFYGSSYPYFLTKINDSTTQEMKSKGIYYPYNIQLIHDNYPEGAIKQMAIGNILESMIAYRIPNEKRIFNEDSLIESNRAYIKNDNYVDELKNFNADKIKTQNEYFLVKGAVAPDFELKDRDGEIYKLEDFKGKNLLLDVWSTTCGPCIKAMPQIKEQLKGINRDKFEILSISLDIDQNKWVKAVNKFSPSGIQLRAEKGFKSQFVKDFLVEFLPRYILIDAQGKIVDFYAKTPSDNDFKKQIVEMIEES